MRVLFIQKEGGIFGAENYHLNIIPALKRAGVEVEFLRLYTDYQLGKDSEFVKRLEKIGIVVHQINIGRLPGWRDVRLVIKTIKEGRFDVVHSHLIHGDLYAAVSKWFIKKNGPKYISTKHGYDNAFSAKYGFDPSKQRMTPYFLLSRWAESRMDASSTISKGLLDFFLAIGLAKKEKMKLIYYGFDFPPVADKPAHDYRRAPYQLCIAGRLVAFKGHQWALEAVALLKEEFPALKLLILGIGQHEAALRDQIATLGIESHVEFLGYRDDVSSWMKYSDVVLVTSRAEGFGVVFLEAFNAGTPVVAFDVPAANELIDDGVSGLLAKPYEPSDLADKIKTLLLQEAKRAEYAAAASRKYHANFRLGKMVEETIAMYQAALHTKE